ncbi:alpha/beta fold hydrolase [Calothrix sp. CCY 0018]|uniref:alpha/beta fold hydrolase n=1 Tax=Calothrix sp. CCY 0018 TaxID=3103864 RepID=UPI0039C6EE2A
MVNSVNWQQKVGNQRDWVWRGWQTRYTYIRPQNPTENNLAKSSPLMLLHGFGASIGHWRHNLEILGDRHTVYALDMLGFGASEKAPANYSVDLWVEQAYDFWKTFIRKPVILIGNSLGSLVSAAAAAKYPEMVSCVVMINLPDPNLEKEAIPAFLYPLVATIKGFVANPLLIKSVFYLIRRPNILRRGATFAYGSPETVTEELLDILSKPTLDRGAANALTALVKSQNNPNYSPNVKKILSTITIPMLLIWGEKDKIIPYALASEFVRHNENIQLLSLANIGHCPHDECPEQVNQAILDWIESVSSEQ